VFNPMAGDVNSGGLSRRHVVQAVEASLRRLQTDRIDLYMAHQVDPLTDLEETMRAFDELVRAGKVLYLGFCNIEAWRVVKALWISAHNGAARLVCIQNEYNLLHRDAEAEMLPMVASEGLSFVAFSPLAGGWLTGKYQDGRPPPSGSRMELRPEPYAGLQNDHTFQAIERLKKISAAYGASTGAVALAWAASHPYVTSILAAPRNADQFKTVDEALGLRLEGQDRQQIAGSIASGNIEDESMSTA
jgi:aryl-alcohol dehydrogenase-like predicted oxidoreductase